MSVWSDVRVQRELDIFREAGYLGHEPSGLPILHTAKSKSCELSRIGIQNPHPVKEAGLAGIRTS
jgi:hypothetical protein